MRKIPTFEEVIKDKKQRGCISKAAHYTSMQGAERARKRMMERYPGQIFDAYSCEFCGDFHVGHIRMHNKVKKGIKDGRK